MSLTVSNCQQICNSPLNHSTSKNLWSFPKDKRFPDRAPNNCAQAFYNLPDQKEKRKAGIGYGTKYDLTKNSNKTPGPDQYNMKSGVDSNKVHNRGYQFGVSRDKMQSQSILGQLNKFSPGPGKYELPSTLSQTRYTMRPKTNSNQLILTKGVPGPGTYNSIQGITDKGVYPISKFTNSGATVFNPSRSKRFQDGLYHKNVPGPGNYKLDNIGIQKHGQYPLSNLSSSKCRSFPHEVRRTGSYTNLATPGPGSYRLPSEFGYYENKTSSIDRLAGAQKTQ